MGNEINKLIDLLDSPATLKSRISYLKNQSDNSEAILGFIELYDQLNGDCTAIKNYFNDSETSILKLIPKRIVRIGSFVKYAAILVITITIGSVFYVKNKTNNRTIDTYYSDPGIPNFMSSESSKSMHNLENILFEFNQKNYNESIRLIKNEAINDNDTLNYYLALNHYYINNYEKSLKEFDLLILNKSTFSDRANYFSALIEIKKENYQFALKRLKKIEDSEELTLKIAVKNTLKQLNKVIEDN